MYRDSQHGLTIDLSGRDGNVYALSGIAKRWNNQMKKIGRPSLIEEADRRPECQNYTDILGIFEEWFPGMFVFINDPRNKEEE